MTTTGQDHAVNMQILQQRPDLEHLLTKPTSVCTYDGTPSVAVLTGSLGNRYGLCASCHKAHQKSLIAQEAIADLEGLRTQIRELGSTSPRFERFIDEMVLLLTVCGDPCAALDAVFRVLASEPVEASS